MQNVSVPTIIAGSAFVVAVFVATVTFLPIAADDVARYAVASGWVSERARFGFGMALTAFPILFAFTAGMLLLLRHVTR